MFRSSHLLIFLLLTVSVISCKNKFLQTEISPAELLEKYSGYVADYSVPPISRCGEIYVRLDFAPDTSLIERINWKEVFTVSPGIEGEVFYDPYSRKIYMQSHGIQYKKKYHVKLDLSALRTVPEHLKFFEFDLEAKSQVWSFHASHPEVKSMEEVNYIGKVSYVDCEPDRSVIENGFKAWQGDRELPVVWSHSVTDSHLSEFRIEGIKRTGKEEKIRVELNMEPLGEEEKATHEVIIPAKTDFKFLEAKIESNDYVQLFFSDPLLPEQNLEGLITLSKGSILRSVIQDNRIDLFLDNSLVDHCKLGISAEIQNLDKSPLKEKISKTLYFTPPKPDVKFAESGHILPPEDGWKVPVKLVSAYGFRLRILKVYEQNAHYFFQTNTRSLAEQTGLERYGKIVLDTIYNTGKENVFDERSYLIDLGAEVKREPRALYKLFLTIPSEYSAYPCDEKVIQGAKDMLDYLNFNGPGSRVVYDDFDYDEYYYYYEPTFYDEHIDVKFSNPCEEYFFSQIHDQRMLICSDVGLVVKYEPEKQRYFSYVSSISTSDPIQGSTVELYNYQGIKLVSGKTGSDGIVNLQTDNLPFLAKVIAPDGQGMYLHLMEEKALSLSTFQVDGKDWQNKAKIHFYGERDVWRPGDSCYVSCIYFDEHKKLPAKLPLNLKLRDPRGRIMKEWTVSDHKMGLFDLRFSTGLNDPTGIWNLELIMGNQKYRHPVRIETVRPNRLKFDVVFAKEKMLLTTDPMDAALSLKWMHGLEAADLKTEVNMQQTSIPNPFGSAFNGYVFDDLTKNYLSDVGLISEEVTNKNGQTKFEIPIEPSEVYPSVMQFNFRLKGFEKGGSFSTDVKTIRYSPYTKYIGVKWPGFSTGDDMIMMEKGKNIQLVCVDASGNKTDGVVTMRTYKIERSWWYDFGSNDLDYSAIKNQNKELVKERKINVKKEGTTIAIDEGIFAFVEFTLGETGHSTGRPVYVFDYNYYNNASDVDQVEVLNFQLEKQEFTVDETLSFDLPAAAKGKFLITVEKGGSIVHQESIPSGANPSRVSIKLRPEMAPTAYVHVHYIAAYKEHKSHRPLRLYGVQPIKVFAPETVLSPILDIAQELRADQNFNLTVKEKNGKKMAYTIAIVDEGLLDITQFKTPQPWDFFFAKEALNIKTWDMYRDIFHRFFGEYTSLLAVGGDESILISPQAKAQRFKPAVRYLGPFVLEAGKTATHTVQINDYVGSVRTMVIATSGQAFGSTQKTSKVVKPLMLYATLPRVLSPGETLKLPVTVFAMKDNIKQVTVEAKCLNADVFNNGSVQNLTFSRIGEKDIYFDMETPVKTDVLRFEITARSGNEFAKEEIEIDLRNASPPVTTEESYVVGAAKSTTISYKPFGMAGTRTAYLMLSSGIDVAFEPLVEKLIRYPHGCLEQTVSSVFPQIYLHKMGLLTETQAMEFRQNLKALIQKLRQMQTSSGGFVYWPGYNSPNYWGTSYAVHFMSEAKKLGYDVPENMIKSALNYQFDAASKWTYPVSGNSYYYGNQDLDQAYRLYGLAQAGKPNFGAMNKLRLYPKLSNTARWLLASALLKVGEKDAADQLIKGVNYVVKDYREFGNTFGSQIRDQAIILNILLAKGDLINGKKIADDLSKHFKGKKFNYLNTQEISFSLMGFAQYIEKTGSAGAGIPLEVSSNGKSLFNDDLSNKPQRIKLDAKEATEHQLVVKNKGKGQVFASVVLHGTPLRDETPAGANDLEMSVVYKDITGVTKDFKKLIQGQEYSITVTLKHPGMRDDYENMALTVMVPAGCEIINTRLYNIGAGNSGQFDYQDIRDDRIYTYFSLKKAETKSFKFLVNASFQGKYWMPSVYAEAMYDGRVNAKSAGFWMTIDPK